jgi:3-hydroxyacyl-CoA dehydrogenase
MHFPRLAGGGRLVEVARARRTEQDVWATALKLGRSLALIAVPMTASRALVGERMRARQLFEAFCLLEEGARPEQVDSALRDFGYVEGLFESRKRADAEVQELVADQARTRGVVQRDIAAEEIVERCVCAMINEGAKILEEGVAARPLDVDLVSVHGYSFPAHRGGPMFYADELGLPRIHRTIAEFRERLGPERWTPAPLIERLAASERRFYSKS